MPLEEIVSKIRDLILHKGLLVLHEEEEEASRATRELLRRRVRVPLWRTKVHGPAIGNDSIRDLHLHRRVLVVRHHQDALIIHRRRHTHIHMHIRTHLHTGTPCIQHRPTTTHTKTSHTKSCFLKMPS
jgi:hypothetical protein